MYLRAGSGRGLLGIYSDDGKDHPGRLLGTTRPFFINEEGGWQKVPVDGTVGLKKGSTVWLAWVFEREAVISVDEPVYHGNLGKSRLVESNFGWNSLTRDRLPAIFPNLGTSAHRIVSIFGLGQVR
jgi:hypothetical protein